MVNKNKCPYIYEKGNKIGEVCGKDCKYEFCYRHSQNKNVKGKDKEKDDDNTIVTSVESAEIQERIAELGGINITNDTSPSNNSIDDNDEILLTKYFVYDCIRDFFREHKEIEDVLSNKKSSGSGSNLTTILGIAGMSLLPILLKNLSGNIIDNAIYNKENVSGLCNVTGVQQPNQPPQGTYSTVERENKRETTENASESRPYNTTPETYLESVKGPRI